MLRMKLDQFNIVDSLPGPQDLILRCLGSGANALRTHWSMSASMYFWMSDILVLRDKETNVRLCVNDRDSDLTR